MGSGLCMDSWPISFALGQNCAVQKDHVLGTDHAHRHPFKHPFASPLTPTFLTWPQVSVREARLEELNKQAALKRTQCDVSGVRLGGRSTAHASAGSPWPRFVLHGMSVCARLRALCRHISALMP